MMKNLHACPYFNQITEMVAIFFIFNLEIFLKDNFYIGSIGGTDSSLYQFYSKGLYRMKEKHRNFL